MSRARKTAASAVAAVLTACGGPAARDSAAGAPSRFPMTVESCGRQVTIESAPQRVFLIGDSLVPVLAAVDALDRVVGMVADPPLQIYDERTRAAVQRIPLLGREASGGSAEISREEILSMRPDLVIGTTFRSPVSPEALGAVGLPNIVPRRRAPKPAPLART